MATALPVSRSFAMRSPQPRRIFVLGATDTIAKSTVGEDQKEVGVARILKVIHAMSVAQLDCVLPTK